MNKSLLPALTVTAALSVMLTVGLLQAEDREAALQLKTPTGWTGETITLPPSFAPTMKLKGTEVIRFAPGMFDAKSDSFFSYAFVFQLEAKPALTRDVLQQETLVYYRGLASAILKNANVDFEPEKFTLQLEATEGTDVGQREGAKTYRGELKWLEPFATRKPQTLHLEMETWQDAPSKQNYLFVCVSPQDPSKAIWKTLRDLRPAL